MFDSNIWNQLSEFKQMINTKFILEKFVTFQLCANDRKILCKQITSDSFKNKITNKLLTYKSCV